MELEQWLRALQPGIQAPGSDDGAAVEGGAGGRQTDRGRETKADVRLGMGF